MNSTMRRVIIDRRMRNRDYRRGDYRSRSDYDMNDYRRNGMRDRNDYGRGEYRGSMDYRGDYAGYDYDDEEARYDGRQGVKGTGRYGIGGSRYYGRDSARESMEYMDYAHEDSMRLTRHDIMNWKEKMENADGSYGEHFTGGQIRQAVQAMGVEMKGYNEKELCLTANMLYSDYCEVLRPFIPKEKEAYVYVNLAKAFFEDPDGSVKGGEKLAAYYYAIVDDDEE